MRLQVSNTFWRDMVLYHIFPVVLILLLSVGAFFFVAIPSARQSLMNARRDKIRDLTEVAWNILEEYKRQADAGEISEAAAQREALGRLGSIRYGPELRDYFWVTDMDHNMVLHPYRPDLVGENLYDYQDPSGNYMFREFKNLVDEHGEGFSLYMWQFQEETNRVVHKVSYAKGFSPWGWIVGTGIYLEEVELEIDRITARSRHAFYIITVIMIFSGIFVVYRAYKTELEKQLALEKVRSSEVRFRAIYDDSFQFMGLLDLNGNLLDANRTSLNAIDQPLEDLVGRPFWTLPWWNHDPVAQERLRKGIIQCAQGETVRFEVTHTFNHGTLVTVDFSLKPIFDAAGNVVQIIPEGREITAMKKYEEELGRKNEELLEARQEVIAAIDNSPAGIILADAPDVTIRMINPAAYEIRGTTADALCNIDLNEHVKNWHTTHLDGTPCEPEELPLSRAVLKGEKVENVELFIGRESGEQRRVLVNAAPIRDAAGKITAGIVIFLDVTEESALRERLAHSERMDSIGQLAGGIAHDFNNMLTGIIGAAELLSIELEHKESVLPMIEMIKTSSFRAADLTKQLLAFSRKNPSVMNPVDIHDLIRQTIQILKRSIDKRIVVKTDLSATSCVTVGDASLLQSALLNLCINARDAMPGGGTLTVSTSNEELDGTDLQGRFEIESGVFLKVDVKDTGVGMDESVMEHIFDPFYTTKDVGQGTGLGLAAVYGTVKNHNAALTVESSPDEGSVFHLYLPVSNGGVLGSSDVQEKTTKGSGCILVVEDEEVVRQMASSQLQSLGYSVLLAEDGLQGLETYKTRMNDIDLVIMDIIMPNMSGADCSKAILKLNAEAKILHWSGYTRNESIASLLKLPNCRFVQKPCRLTMLSQSILELLNQG